jgi:putative adhesin
MYALLRTSFLFFILTQVASAASEENINQQKDAAPGGKLVVDVDFGTINVVTGADDKVVIEAYRKIDFGNEAKEKEYFAAAPVAINQDGNIVTVRAHCTTSKRLWSSGHSEMDGRYTIRIPKRFETDLHTEGGDVTAGEITGNMTVKTDGGKLVFKHLEGTLTADTSGGSIEVGDCRGPIQIETSGGDIVIADGAGTLDAKTSGGRIDVRNFSGDAEVRTNGGNLSLQRVTGKIIGKTSSGSIRASISDADIGDVKLETSAGNIDFSLPLTATVDIDASTSVGKVSSRLPLETANVGREHLRGKLNGGGKSVELKTSVGNITIEPSSSEMASR